MLLSTRKYNIANLIFIMIKSENLFKQILSIMVNQIRHHNLNQQINSFAPVRVHIQPDICK